jgi:hypothetical protein
MNEENSILSHPEAADTLGYTRRGEDLLYINLY